MVWSLSSALSVAFRKLARRPGTEEIRRRILSHLLRIVLYSKMRR